MRVWNDNFTKVLKNNNLLESNKYLQQISLEYHYEQKMLLKEYINYLIIKKELISEDFFMFVENAYHNLDITSVSYCNYIVLKLMSYLNEL